MSSFLAQLSLNPTASLMAHPIVSNAKVCSELYHFSIPSLLPTWWKPSASLIWIIPVSLLQVFVWLSSFSVFSTQHQSQPMKTEFISCYYPDQNPPTALHLRMEVRILTVIFKALMNWVPISSLKVSIPALFSPYMRTSPIAPASLTVSHLAQRYPHIYTCYFLCLELFPQLSAA